MSKCQPKIIVVGNSSNLLEIKNGDKIDSFDYVVRMGMCRTEEYKEYVGVKTDLLCGFVNDFVVPHYVDKQIQFHIKIYVNNCKNLLFLEHVCDDYREFTPLGTQWGIGYLPVPAASAGEYYFKFFNSHKFKSFFSTKKYSERTFFDYVQEALHAQYGIKEVSFYSKANRIKIFTQFNQLIKQDRMYMPSKGMYILDYIINKFPNTPIYVTGFDGIKTKNYWRKEDTPWCVTHSSTREMVMYKKLLRVDKIREL